ncbi:N-acetyltransferase [Alkalihalobacillus alcalophilus ATCC 27647 = CGMCC 1.3604]|uniref:Acetyltransferase n=1 Tax=Alkalihalobacillus alcalophilus ATCC 27647 = CGMCC 1.3604 TaxID=1218173 RepID=A0A094YQI6_ALKAL|nr:GNAT family N-acetyltransferase [Alkalihalobacillus alcalophilus]KGA95717.1 acetyltransferase [Alkalihalobacillus alcalophilus ATCC 27647 = CGMCC 1.3604]MED1564276.1 GNAT family N-acetyltransferase [Alkalihalobacillus alcalophilus]THG88707.1 N-acetyltransferase [Alkalihalobacillus alcalophilus ATCC 27647 = CGMCC 1.3604]
MSGVIIRRYTLEDFPALLEVQKEAFPPPFPEDLWWNKDQIQAHVTTFPEGALLAEIDGVVVGSATSLLKQYDGKPHTWEEVADSGYIQASHHTNGDSLYGIDVCVRPSYRGIGVARALYQARKETVLQLGLKRFLAGCRIPNYHEYAKEIDVQTYVNKVKNGDIRDLVLTFMLKQGLQPLQILPNYLDDEESCHYGVLVEWQPSFK